MKTKKEIVGEYVGHVFMGFVMCTVLVLFSAALILLIRAVSGYVGDRIFTEVMETVEKVLLTFDVGFLMWWVLYSAYKVFKELSS